MERLYKCKDSNRVQTKLEWIKEYSDYIDYDSDVYPTERQIFNDSLSAVEYAIDKKELIAA